jgi:hypothetical protein
MDENPGNKVAKWISGQPRYIRLLIGAAFMLVFVALVVPFTPEPIDMFFYVIAGAIFVLWTIFFWRDLPAEGSED